MSQSENSPSVSVIVPIYKVEKYIERCAISLLSQTLKDIEYIFINDNSPDKSMDILSQCIQKYPSRSKQIKIITHQQNLGSAAARNDGTKIATGQYIIHCDGDDWVEKDMYEKMYQKAIKENADIVICDYYAEYSKKRVYHSQHTINDKNDFLKRLLWGKLHNCMWNKLIKRELYAQLDFTWINGINMWEDVSIISRLAFYSNTIAYIPTAFYHYTQTNNNAYTKIWNLSSLDNVAKVIHIIDDFFTQQGESYQRDLFYFKLRAKYTLLRHAPKELFNKYRLTFPETTPYVFNHPAFSSYDKVVMWCWIHSYDFIASAILNTLSIIKKKIR